MGNHDYAVAYSTDCRCADEIHELSVYTRLNVTLKLLSKEQVYWLQNLNVRRLVEISGRTYIAVHGSPGNPLYGYLRADLPPLLLEQYLKTEQEPKGPVTVVTGHTHLPVEFTYKKYRVVNPGSCGQPRDGD